jgi:hypothetical protein
MKEQLRIKNEGFKMKSAIGGLIGMVVLLVIASVFREYLNELGTEHNIAKRAYSIEEVEHDRCIYLFAPRLDKFIHKANCPNPDHKTEGK